MNVAEYIAKFLVEKKVRHVFGYQGGAILKLLDEMIATGEIEYVQNFHEQASAFSADAYSRVTGNLGVAMATSGPGATNLITGIANAYMDSIPTLFITGQDYLANATNNNGARQNGFQDLDVVSMVKPITKYAVMVTDEHRIRYEMEKAYWFAKNGRPGSVLVDVPIDIQFKQVDPDAMEAYIGETVPMPETFDMQEVIALMKQTKRPVILVGGGARISGAHAEAQAFAERTNIPVISTLNALDLVKGSYGFAGLYGNLFSNMAVQNADLLFAFGVRFGQQQVGKAPQKYTNARVVHVDIDANEIGRIFPDEIGIEADVKTFLRVFTHMLEREELPTHPAWHARIQQWAHHYRAHAYVTKDNVEPVQAVEAISGLLAPHAIITNDVGQNQMWVAQGFRAKEGQRLLNSCGLGSMGYSLPAAIGAKTAYPERQVIAFTGDGGLQMNLQEFMLINLRQLAIKCIVFNNNTLGMMREVQTQHYNGHYYGSNLKEFACVNLEKLALAYGIEYKKIESLAQIPSLAPCLANDKPYLIELVIAFDSLVSNRHKEAEFLEKEWISA